MMSIDRNKMMAGITPKLIIIRHAKSSLFIPIKQKAIKYPNNIPILILISENVTNLPRIYDGDSSAVYNGAISNPVPLAMPSNTLPNTITP